MYNSFEELQKAAEPLIADMFAKRNSGTFADSPFETVFFLEKGRKYHRIVQDTRVKETGKMFEQRSVAAFLDNEGNIYKSASWKAPAKGVRGTLATFQNASDQSGYIKYAR